MLNLFYYDFGVRLIKPDPNIYYRTIRKSPALAGDFLEQKIQRQCQDGRQAVCVFIPVHQDQQEDHDEIHGVDLPWEQLPEEGEDVPVFSGRRWRDGALRFRTVDGRRWRGRFDSRLLFGRLRALLWTAVIFRDSTPTVGAVGLGGVMVVHGASPALPCFGAESGGRESGNSGCLHGFFEPLELV